MHPAALASLRCPLCATPLARAPGAVRCAGGHAFDVARQGYVSFLAGRPTGLAGDDGAMVAARDRFLGAGHLEPLDAAIAARLREAAPGPGLVVEVGAGTAHHLARALDALPEHAGLAIDLSKHAARRAARAHPRAGAIAADACGPLPLADGCAAVVLDVFAPRNPAEWRRILRGDGYLLVATPGPDHLAELRAPLGLLEIDPGKDRRLEAALAPGFVRAEAREARFTMALTRDDARAVAAMGPSARHVPAGALAERVARLPERVEVTASVMLSVWRPRDGRP